ncbi:MAG: hypothetical protein Kow00109_04230 [Acidobacteriota bacterium]
MLGSRRLSVAESLQKLRVPAGFLFGLLFLVTANPCYSRFFPGLGLAVLGSGLRLWAAGHLRKHRELTVSGPYRWTRNPLYLGSFAMGLGLTVAAGAWWLILLFLALFFGFYYPVMIAEERELLSSYGEPAREYIATTPRFVPLGGHAYRRGAGAFAWAEVVRNREHHTVLGLALVVLYLLIERSLLCGS